MNIQMVDLVGQHQKIRAEIDDAISEIIEKAWFIKGQPVANFEHSLASYLDINHVVGCANGTDALQAAFMALDLPQGSEVIVPDFTFIATAEVLAVIGLRPVFVDVEKYTFNLDLEKVAEAITPKTKAIVPVHMFGQPCDMEGLMALANEHSLFVVEDAAQALGSEYTFSDGRKAKAGTIGHLGCTSFFPSKNLACMGDGGAVFTNDSALGTRVSQICNHGMDAQYNYKYVGINSRLDALQAGILSVKLPLLDDYNNARRAAATAYSKRLKAVTQLELPIQNENSKHIFHQFTLIVKDDSRNQLQAHLSEKGIPVKVYYPSPFHSYEAYKEFVKEGSNLDVSTWLCDHVISLPMHTELNDEQIDYISNEIINFYN